MFRNKFLHSIALLLFFIPPVLRSQDAGIPVDEESGLITYQEVVEEVGDRESFFNRSISWINGYFANPVDATKTRDPESGLIKGLYRFRIKNTLDDGTEVDAGTVQYNFILEFKEGRYRYTLTEFVLRQASKYPCENWLNSTDPQAKSYLKQLDEFAQGWISSLKEGMMPEPEKKADDW